MVLNHHIKIFYLYKMGVLNEKRCKTHSVNRTTFQNNAWTDQGLQAELPNGEWVSICDLVAFSKATTPLVVEPLIKVEPNLVSNKPMREMSNYLKNEQIVRSQIKYTVGESGKSTRFAVYFKPQNKLICNTVIYDSLNAFTLAHLIDEKEHVNITGKPTRDGWTYAKVELNGKWVSANKLPLL